MITADSPLYNLPKGLEPRQVLFLEGTRVAAQMTELAYRRLQDTLYALAASRDTGGVDLGQGTAAALLDAWSIIDTVNRLRDLQAQMPGMKKRDGYRWFRKATDDVATLRNVIQHLNQEIPKMVDGGFPLWGTLRWFALTHGEEMKGCSCVLMPGRLVEGEFPVANPAGKKLDGLVDLVTLSCKATDVGLSDVYRTVAHMVGSMEQSLEVQFANLPRRSADLIMCVEMQFSDPDAKVGDDDEEVPAT